jgi:uncharacterized membrane protein
MRNGMLALASAVALFAASHLILSLPRLRDALVARLGENTFRGLYSAIALALLLWVALAYRDAPIIDVWYPPIGLMHLSLLIMPLATILLVAGLTTPNPSAIGAGQSDIINGGPVGILKVTRHPIMWAVVLWGFAHLLANGDAASLILFGGITFLALIGAAAQEAKKRRQFGADWQGFAQHTSFLPPAALLGKRTRLSFGEIGWWRIALGIGLFALLLWLHPWLFGVNPLPL